MLEKVKNKMIEASGFFIAEERPIDVYRAKVVAGELDRSGRFIHWHVTQGDTNLDEEKKNDLLDKAGTLCLTALYLDDGLLDLHYPSTGVYPPEFGDGYDAPDNRKYLTEVNDLARAMRRLNTLPTEEIKKHILFEYAVRYSDQQGISMAEAVDKVAEVLKQSQY